MTFLECCERIEISGGSQFSTSVNFGSNWSNLIPTNQIGVGTYMKIGVDGNGRPIYQNDDYIGAVNLTGSSLGMGNMILAFDNIPQQWIVSTYIHIVIYYGIVM